MDAPTAAAGSGAIAARTEKRQARQGYPEIHGEFLAIDTALADLKSGDLCLILVDQIEEALAHIAKRVAEG